MCDDEDRIFGKPSDAPPDWVDLSPQQKTVCEAIFHRLWTIKHNGALNERRERAIYDGSRTNLGAVARRLVFDARFRGVADAGGIPADDLVRRVHAGELDQELVDEYQSRAEAEYYYRFEKDYR